MAGTHTENDEQELALKNASDCIAEVPVVVGGAELLAPR